MLNINMKNMRIYLFTAIAGILFFYSLWVGIFGAPHFLIYRPRWLMMLLILGFLFLPSKVFKQGSLSEKLFNSVLIIGAIVTCLYVEINWLKVTMRFGVNWTETILGCVLILIVMELTRRTAAKALNYIFIFVLLYALFGNLISGLFNHGGMSINRVIMTELYTHEGLFGSAFGVGTYFIGLFIFFVAFLEVSGGADRFMNFTLACAGTLTGGPAKVAVMASALLGMISGSSVTNIVTTGSITIPMMKKRGFQSHTAAGIESTASLGSQITPPIMGAAAYLIAEYTGHSYLDVMLAALIPCILFYWGVYSQVHFRAIKNNIKGIPREELPDLKKATIGVLPFIVPMIILVILLYNRYSTQLAISATIFSFFVVLLLDKESRPKILKRFIEGLRTGGENILPVMCSLCVAGLIIGLLTITGLGDRLTFIISELSGGSFVLTVIFTALATMILGMGMVTVGAYIFVATLTAPLLESMGVPLLSAHLFIFYFAVLSAISPPVMIGVFAACGIAKSKLIPTALAALRYSIMAFVVPFLFIFNPSLLILENGLTLDTLFYFSTTFIGVLGIASSFEKQSFFGKVKNWEAVVLFLSGSAALLTHKTFSIIGVIILALIYSKLFIDSKRSLNSSQTVDTNISS
ncbi:TRAP transporter permease [Salirhabdus salicampi]|uniref:TRAP transporter permease n=1 Tax=Salirhabdus salicampi TaxID=476102 RepID=UPI0020C2F815|nr:TRAP transporter fused permease subunit [Salirhabdus salicampi]MCP8615253.1 TRAP transporter fused permease subunit [Salirhabdus salicampi]